MKKIRAVISFVSFLLLIGTIGGMEKETIRFSVGTISSVLLLIVFIWGAKPWMR